MKRAMKRITSFTSNSNQKHRNDQSPTKRRSGISERNQTRSQQQYTKSTKTTKTRKRFPTIDREESRRKQSCSNEPGGDYNDTKSVKIDRDLERKQTRQSKSNRFCSKRPSKVSKSPSKHPDANQILKQREKERKEKIYRKRKDRSYQQDQKLPKHQQRKQQQQQQKKKSPMNQQQKHQLWQQHHCHRNPYATPGCHNKMETNILYSSGSSFEALWSSLNHTSEQKRETVTSMPIRDKISILSNLNPNPNTVRSRAEGSKTSRPAHKLRNPKRDESTQTSRSSNIKLAEKETKEPMKENLGQNDSNQKRCKSRSRSLKKTNHSVKQCKRIGARSRSVPPKKNPRSERSKRSVKSKSQRPRLPTNKTPTKRKKISLRPLERHFRRQRHKKDPGIFEESSETSRTDRTDFTTSSHNSRSRSRASSRRSRKSRSPSSSRRLRSSKRKNMRVEDALRLLYPKNHPTYLIQSVISSSEDEEDSDSKKKGIQIHMSTQRPQRRTKRNPSRDRGFSGLSFNERHSRKGRRPNRHCQEAISNKETPRITEGTSPKHLAPVSSKGRMGRSCSREPTKERRHSDKRCQSRLIGQHNQKTQYPNPFVKPG